MCNGRLLYVTSSPLALLSTALSTPSKGTLMAWARWRRRAGSLSNDVVIGVAMVDSAGGVFNCLATPCSPPPPPPPAEDSAPFLICPEHGEIDLYLSRYLFQLAESVVS